MRCDHCLTELPEPSQFCTKCGEPLTPRAGILVSVKRLLRALFANQSSAPAAVRRDSIAPDAVGSPGEGRRILAEVNRRKERARQSGVIRSAFALYDENLPYYDAWIKNCPDLVHPAIKVEASTEEGGREDRTKRIEAVIRGNRYTFTFHQTTTFMPDGEEYTGGFLDVDFQGARVLTIDCNCDDDRYAGRTWSANDVSAFIEGPWVTELNEVFAEITYLHDTRNRLAQENSRRAHLEKLKRNFGL